MEIYRKLFDLTGQQAVVIGAGSGIGRAGALALAAHGASVCCADLAEERAQETAEAIGRAGGRAFSVAVDVGEEDQVEGLFRRVDEVAGRLDTVVCTPGINVRKPLLEVNREEFSRVIRVNLEGTFHVLRAAGRRLAEAGGGSLIALSSIRAQVVEPGQGVYAATKAGILQLVRALAAELGPRGVRANAVAPGVVETPLTAPIRAQPEWYAAYAVKNALGRWARPEELAGAIVFLAAPASSYVTGSLLVVDGGWLAVDGRFSPPL